LIERTATAATDMTSDCVAGLLVLLATGVLVPIDLTVASELTDRPIQIENISPTHTSGAAVTNGSVSGRINSISKLSGMSSTLFAATEWNGLFRSNDGGEHWVAVTRYLPRVAMSVAVSPADTKRVVATSVFDGRSSPHSGIATSADGGETWTYVDWGKLTTDVSCADETKRSPSAAGISFDPGHPKRVAAGTNCGLALSEDGGVSWDLLTADPKQPATMVWDVRALDGFVYGCGDEGFFRLDVASRAWSYPDPGQKDLPPNGRCSLAISPQESAVLYETVGQRVFESLNRGDGWTDEGAPEKKGSDRIPFVATAASGANTFDLWYGDAGLMRRSCSRTDAAQTRCFVGETPWTSQLGSERGAHDDVGDLIFENAPGLTSCPRLFATDGGIYINDQNPNVPPGCLSPQWRPPTDGPAALWIMALGASHTTKAEHPALFLGAQDDGLTVGSVDDSKRFAWINLRCCDTFDVVPVLSGAKILFSECCYDNQGTYESWLFVATADGSDEQRIAAPTGALPGWIGRPTIAALGKRGLVVLTDKGAFRTGDLTASAVKWAPLGAPSIANGCNVQVVSSALAVTIYVLVGRCNGASQDVLWRYTTTAPAYAGKWVPVPSPRSGGGIGVFGVDPRNPKRIIASSLMGREVAMFRSENAGAGWTPMPDLDRLMTAGGMLQYFAAEGRNDWGLFDGYAQPRLVAFSTRDAHLVIAGGVDGGLFVSANSGINWKALTKPVSGVANPEIVRPQAAYFDTSGDGDIYVSTQGSGIWRVTGAAVGATESTAAPR
jgi:hypothetical protein